MIKHIVIATVLTALLTAVAAGGYANIEQIVAQKARPKINQSRIFASASCWLAGADWLDACISQHPLFKKWLSSLSQARMNF